MNRILIVDDEESIQILYDNELTEEGYDVITSGDGSQLIELIEQKRPDLIVLDIRLGKNNGLDLLQDIRNTYYNLPVILCTAYSTRKDDLKSIAADYYVLKSAELSELKRKIKMALEDDEQLPAGTTANDLRKIVTPLQYTLWGEGKSESNAPIFSYRLQKTLPSSYASKKNRNHLISNHT